MINLSDILISGYYGFRNSGDDALLLAIIQDLKKYKKDVNLAVLSKSPKETAQIYGVRTVNRMNPFAVIWNIMKCKLLLSGGGTLIQDGTSTQSLLYYLTIIKIAHLLGKKVMLYSNGIGPLREEHRKMTKQVLNKTDMITLRDQASLSELEALGVDRPKIILTADPAFNLNCSRSQKGKALLTRSGIQPEGKIACISVRKWKGVGDDFCRQVAKAADYLSENYGYQILFLPMQPDKDYEISMQIKSQMTAYSAVPAGQIGIDDMLAMIQECDLCIGMRLHSLIYSVCCRVPVIGLVYDPKIAGFMDYMNQNLYTDAAYVTFDKLKNLIDVCCGNIENIKKEIDENLTTLKVKAEENAKLAIALLEKSERGKSGE